jgi:hypothetical protein
LHLQVAALYAANQSATTDDAPYAELWVSTHPAAHAASCLVTLMRGSRARPGVSLSSHPDPCLAKRETSGARGG